MVNFRQFDAGPDPFGRTFHVYFKWLQTAISLRHADTVDVRFVLEDETGEKIEKTIALPHAELLRVCAVLNRRLEDAWCARIAAMHLVHLIETGEDIEKDLVTMLPGDIERYATELTGAERAAARLP